jgi:hypothetical protein
MVVKNEKAKFKTAIRKYLNTNSFCTVTTRTSVYYFCNCYLYTLVKTVLTSRFER